MKDLDLEDLACRQELTAILGIKSLSHEDFSNLYCVHWLKAHEAHFSRAKTLEMADLTGSPQRSMMGPINYRPRRTSIARIKARIPVQLRAVDKLLEPKSMGLPDTAYMGAKLAVDPRYGGS